MSSNVTIILTVQSCGKDRYRLGINTKDSNGYFKKRGVLVKIMIGSIVIQTKTKCGPPNNLIPNKKYKKGFDIYDPLLNEWIRSNQFHIYMKYHPTKLQFRLDLTTYTLKYFKKIII
jgi:hypothetical protein